MSKALGVSALAEGLMALEKKIDAIKEHWYESVPPFTMPFINCQDESVQKYIRDMTEWGRVLVNILEDRKSEDSTPRGEE